MKSSRTKATSISSKVRKQVFERDKHCIVCGRHDTLTVAHYISRAKSGKGIPQNLVVLCMKCHMAVDNGNSKERADDIRLKMKTHLARHYTYWNERDLVYRKWG